MAKRDMSVNKTQLIRDLIAQGMTSAKEIAAKMAEQGHKISMPTVYTTLTEARKSTKGASGKKRGRPARAVVAELKSSSNGAPRNGQLSLDELTALASLARKAGGAEALKSFLDGLAVLSA